MTLAACSYTQQEASWPKTGRHILAHFDNESVMVYQAYRPSIAAKAVEQQRLGGGGFSYSRMSWIKPNFLWMMYRSGWGLKENQEATLGIRIRRDCFDNLLCRSVQSTYFEGHYSSRDEWSEAIASSDVRLQWDPDHDPTGRKLERRALQLGLRGDALKRFGMYDILEVLDLSAFVAEQRKNATLERLQLLQMPEERVYTPSDPAVADIIGLTDLKPSH